MTAVEWLLEELKQLDKKVRSYKRIDYIKKRQSIIQQAIEMEKQQMIDSFIEGHNVCRCVTDNTDEAKECFDEWFKTYKTNNQ